MLFCVPHCLFFNYVTKRNVKKKKERERERERESVIYVNNFHCCLFGVDGFVLYLKKGKIKNGITSRKM